MKRGSLYAAFALAEMPVKSTFPKEAAKTLKVKKNEFGSEHQSKPSH